MNDEITRAVLARQPEYPPEQSMGGINTHTVACRVAGYSPGYCVCLHKIAAYERDSEIKSAPQCEQAIRNKECPALVMRAEERAAGKALYFVDRALLREEMDKFFATQNTQFRVTRPTPAKPATVSTGEIKKNNQPVKPAITSTVKSNTEEDGYAAAINAAIREANVAPPEQPKPEAPAKSAPPSNQGMTLLEKALLHLNKTQ